MNDADFELLRAASPVRAELAECRRVADSWCDAYTKVRDELAIARELLSRVNEFFWPPDMDLAEEAALIQEINEFVSREVAP